MLSYLLGNKGKDLENLFSTSFSLNKTGDFETPYMNRLIFSGILPGLLFFSSMMLFYKWNAGWGFLICLFTLMVLVPYAFFFHIRLRANLSWFSYAGITNKPSTNAAAQNQISKIAWSLRLLALIELLVATRQRENTENVGFVTALKQMIIGLIATVLDVAEDCRRLALKCLLLFSFFLFSSNILQAAKVRVEFGRG
jgi:hypothetical protein